MSSDKLATKSFAAFLFAITFLIAFLCFNPTKVNAVVPLNPDPGGLIPFWEREYLRNCDTHVPLQSPAFSQWASPAGNSSVYAGTFNVPSGATPISLRYNWASAVCANNSAVLQTTLQFANVAPGVAGLPSGSALNHTGFFGPGNFNVPGTFRNAHHDYTYLPPGGFTTSGTYTIPIGVKRINQFSNGAFLCVGNGVAVANALDFGPCVTVTTTVSVFVNVPPPPPPPPNWDVGVSSVCNATDGTVTFNAFKTTGTVPGSVTVNMDISLTSPNNAANAPTSVALTDADFPWSSGPIAVSPPPSAGQFVNSSISISPGGAGAGNNAANDSANCAPSQKFDHPYLRVYGHDTVVGLPFADPLTGACTRPKVAGQNIETFARNNGGDFVGAGSQFAASATGLIDDYISASLRNDNPGAPATPTGLSFGNYNGGNLGFGSTGSDASGYRGCIPDYVSTLSDTYFTLGPSLGGAQAGFNYRDGDLIINSNITYPSSSTWTSLDDLQGSTGGWPVIIVKGNIYIRPSVNRIDAILIAVPEDPVKGIIGTCVPDEPAGGVFGECLNKLEINGALVARKVYFNRLNGDINNPSGDEPASSGNIAEVINFYPEFFLRFSKSTDDSSLDSKSRYESIVGLPPVL